MVYCKNIYISLLVPHITLPTQMDNRDIIIEALQRYGGPQKQASGWKMVRCPFHGDTDPSLGVYTALDGVRKLGFFNCFGCGAKGYWNTFAQKTGLPEINDWEKPSAINSVSPEDEQQLLGNVGLTFKEVLKRMSCEEAQRWPQNLDWRGYSGKLLYDLGAHIVNDAYNESVAVLFPIKIAGKVRGGIKAIFEKTKKSQLGYLTMSGEWSKKYGLFPYLMTKKLIETRGYDFVILVEGPRDALRLVQNGIPALAILGAKSFSKTKALFITALGTSTVYVMPDGDEGGKLMWDRVRQFITSGDTTLKRISLPIKDKAHKLDPDNMPLIYLKRLVSLLVKRHNFDKSSVIEY